ncbi:MAG TPA: PspC domain-containing protein [Aliicoccus persicus]|uniref:PspC domain-containing protein n=1 Tax=Aliicoccus persicus TaxID=930138 RepID=A0A921B4N7_9STAP|nr:PspC domain-containing protein [Aliicoccus persicus]
MGNKIRTSSTNKVLFGVCGGISEKYNIPSIWIRILFILCLPLSTFIYFILLNFVFDDGYL